MKLLFVLICAILLGRSVTAQYTAPRVANIQWQRCLGGSGTDFVDDNAPNLYTSEQKPLLTTADGGYLVGGSVQSNDGDVSGNHGAIRYLVGSAGSPWKYHMEEDVWRNCQ